MRSSIRPYTLALASIILLCSLPGSSAAGLREKPKVEPWQFNGLRAALRDPSEEVKILALDDLGHLNSPEAIELVTEFLDPKYPPALQEAALKAYAGMKVQDRLHLPKVLRFLESSDGKVIADAIQALAAAGVVPQYRSRLEKFLNDNRDDNGMGFYAPRGAAAVAFADAGLGSSYQTRILELLHYPNFADKDAAMRAVVRAGLRDPIGTLLASDPRGLSSTAIVVDEIIKAGLEREFRPQITKLFNQNNHFDKGWAGALAAHPELNGVYQKPLLSLLDEELDKLAMGRRSVNQWLLVELAKAGIVDHRRARILTLATKENLNRDARSLAMATIAYAGWANQYKTAIQGALSRLRAEQGASSFAGIVSGLADSETVGPFLPQILPILDDRWGLHSESSATAILEAIRGTPNLSAEALAALLEPAYDFSSLRANGRFAAHYAGGGRRDPELLLAVLARGDATELRSSLKGQGERRRAFDLLAALFQVPHYRKELRAEIATTLADLSELIDWSTADKKKLQTAHDHLAKDYHGQAEILGKELLAVERKDGLRWWGSRGAVVILLHLSFWIGLIFFYPRSASIQAMFFWNPWIRKIMGCGYVGVALRRLPFLRRRLFAPFRQALLAESGLRGFSEENYFGGTMIREESTGEEGRITEWLKPGFEGQFVLVGESGLGKSMFLRHLAATSPFVTVFLPAERCAGGVLEAIQAKLLGQANDLDYLNDLLWSGALDIYIDGLNEVTADTRARISQFTETFSRANVLMTTQPMEWRPPGMAKVYVLEPLEREQIQKFLESRERLLPADAAIRGAAYRKSCVNLLAAGLGNEDTDTQAQILRILSNPMDLTVVADMIAHGKSPDLFRLQQQQYELMATDYARIHAGQPFPLTLFSEAVYQLRLTDKRELTTELFGDLLETLARFKLVLRREEKEGRVWLFRHDKVMEFFLVQAFLGTDNKRPDEHLSDPRFRGVYLMLATLLPYEEAMALREKLLQYAADSKDHSISDTFIQLLRSRETPNDATKVA